MVTLFIFNLFISLLLFCYYLRMRTEGTVIRLIIMILLPIVGIVLFVLLDISFLYVSTHKNKKTPLKKEEEAKFISLFLRKSEIDKWEDIVPIEDALVLNNKKTRRNLVVNTLKGDAYTNLRFLKKALKDKDTEISHYAAVVVMELKRKLTLDIHQCQVKYELANKNDFLVNEAYAEALKKYTQSGLLDNETYIKYMDTYSKVLENIINTENVKEFYYEDKIRCDIVMKKYDETISICRKYMNEFPKSCTPYILLLKIYFLKNDRKRFDELIKELILSNIKIEGQSLEIVRFWLRGDH